MVGKKNGLSALFQSEIPCLFVCRCFVHRLNLANKNGLDNFSNLNFKENLEIVFDISNYIHSSATRMERFRLIQKFNNYTKKEIIKPVPTRWSSNFFCLNSIVENFLNIYNFISDEILIEKIEKVKIMKENICSADFIHDISILHTVLKEINKVIVKLQKRNIDIATSKKLINNLKVSLLSTECYEIAKTLYLLLLLLNMKNF
jgi:hypothetical protein